MPVSVTIYYRGGEDGRGELAATLGRIRRRIGMLTAGRRLEVAEQREKKVAERIEKHDADKADRVMLDEFNRDMRDLSRTCYDAVAAPASFHFREDPASVVWVFRGRTPIRNDIDRLMSDAGYVGEPESLGSLEVVRYPCGGSDPRRPDACNRIRSAVEAAARFLWEVYGGKETVDPAGEHAAERKIGSVAKVGRCYGAVRIAGAILARTGAEAGSGGTGDARAGGGRGQSSGIAGGLCLAAERWLGPEAEMILWIRETIKWLKREGATERDEIEAQIGARVGNDPKRDMILFKQTVAAITASGVAYYDGSILNLR